MKPRTLFFLLLATLTLVRVWVAFTGEVPSSTAYYFLCSEHPAPAYFDGPPGTAMMLRAVNTLNPAWIGPLWGVLASLACWRLAVRLTNATAAAAGTAALNLVPAFNAASLQVSPELPALTFMLLGITAVWDASRGASRPSWLVAAAAFAAATAFSYVAAFVALAAALAGCLSKRAGIPWRLMGGIGILTAVIAMLWAPLAWNASQAWIPLAGWTPRGLMGLQWGDIGAGIWFLILGVSPVFAFLIGKALFRSDFALLVTLPSWIWTLLCIYRGWDDVPLVALAVWLPIACIHLPQWAFVTSCVVGAAFCFPVFHAPMQRQGVIENAGDLILALDKELAPRVPEGLFFIAGDPALAASLGYNLRSDTIPPEGHPRVYVLESQDLSNQFDLWPSYDDFVETPAAINEFFTEQHAANPFQGHSAIYIGHESPGALPQAVGGAFSEVQLVRELGTPHDRLFIYLCLDYQTLPL